MTEEQALINVLMGVFAPWLLAVIMQRSWGDMTRTIVAALAYIVLSFVSAIFLNPIDLTDQGWRQIVLTLASIALPAYYTFKLLWQPAGVIAKIEKATTPAPEGAA